MEGRHRQLEARLDTVGWGLLFIAVGAVLLMPGFPDGTWLVAAGAVMIGAGFVRVAVGLPIVWTTACVGVAAFVAGVAQAGGFERAAGPLVLLALGVTLIGAAAYRPATHARVPSMGQEGR
jgi:hypothetical protein